MYCTLNEYVDVQAVLDYVRTVLLTFCLLREARLISPFRFVDCSLLASRRDDESKTTQIGDKGSCEARREMKKVVVCAQTNAWRHNGLAVAQKGTPP